MENKISFELKIIGEIIDKLDDNVDVEVILENKQTFSATFFTLKNIEKLMNTYKNTKECLDGLYFWSSNMIIIKNLSTESIKNTIEDMLKSKEFETAFLQIK